MEDLLVAERSHEALFDALTLQPADALLALIGAYRGDPRADKIDVGVGVYRTPDGNTPIMRAVKQAERRLLETQPTKGYLGPEGDIGFFNLLKPIIFGDDAFDGRLSGLQTPGGTGALRIASELIARARPGARIWVGAPTWPNHPPIFKATGLAVEEYRHFDVAHQELTFGDLLSAGLNRAQPGDVALLHGCCHNPTGADFSIEQWTTIAHTLRDRGVLPLIDLAYQGLGVDLDADVAGARLLLDIVGEGLIAYSCDKNFGLYRERVGALYALSKDAEASAVLQSNMLALTRANWSMPPDHGAAIVRVILEDESLTADWRTELAEMTARIRGIRSLLANADPSLAALEQQRGMFSTLPLSADQVAWLRQHRAIYMPSSGRINIAGLTEQTVPAFVAALASLR